MFRFQFACLAGLCCLVAVGCQNRSAGYNPYATGGGYGVAPQYGAPQYGAPQSGSGSRIAPPSTYSLQIPSAGGAPTGGSGYRGAQAQPYYTPGSRTASQANHLLNTRSPAPTPVDNTGWRKSSDNQVQPPQTPLTPAPTSLANNPNRLQSVLDQPATRTASLPATGLSQTPSPNYATTEVDETRDPTRVPVTDASLVRAPSRNNPTGQYPTGYQVPGASNVIVPQNAYAQAPRTSGTLAQAPLAQSYRGTAIFAAPTAYRGQLAYAAPAGTLGAPAAYYNPVSASVGNLVVASNSTTSGTQVGWRDRELNSDRVERY